MTPNIRSIAAELAETHRSNSIHIRDLIADKLLEVLDSQLEAWTKDVIDEMREIEHPEPRTKAEWDERSGQW